MPFELKNGGIVAGNKADVGGADVCFYHVGAAAPGIELPYTLTLPDPETFGIEGLDKWFDDDPGDRFDEESTGRESITNVAETTYLIAGQVNTVTFDSDGGSYVAPKLVVYGKTVTEPEAPTRQHYDFVNWTLDGQAFDFATLITEDITLKANWKAKTYTLDFVTDGGDTYPQESYEALATANFADKQPTKEGFVFTGWYDNAQCEGDPITTLLMDDNKTVYAGWRDENAPAEPGVTIEFDTRGGTPAPDPVFVPYSAMGLTEETTLEELGGEAFVVNLYDYLADYAVSEPTLDGYEFLFWSADYFDVMTAYYQTYPDSGVEEEIEEARASIDSVIAFCKQALATGKDPEDGSDLTEEDLEGYKETLLNYQSYYHVMIFSYAEAYSKEDFLTPALSELDELYQEFPQLEYIMQFPDGAAYYEVYAAAADLLEDYGSLDMLLNNSFTITLIAEYAKDGEIAFWDEEIPDPTPDVLDNAILTSCVTGHSDQNVWSGLLGTDGQDYTITHEDGSAVATVTVTNTQLYVDNYEQETSLSGHSFAFAAPTDLTVRLLYVEGEGWQLPESNSAALTLYVADIKDPQPGELTTLLDGVTIQCVSGVGHPAYTVGVAMAGCEVTRTGATTATLTIGNEHFVWLYNNYAPEIGGIEHTLAPSSATSYTIELEYKNGAWALVDPADKGSVVFQVVCSTSAGEDKPDDDHDDNGGNGDSNNNANNNANRTNAAASATANASVIPQTGDTMPVGLLAGLAVVAAGGLAALLVLRKRREQ